MKIAQSVQRRKIIRIALNNPRILFYRRWYLSRFEIPLGRTQGLYFIERHVLLEKSRNEFAVKEATTPVGATGLMLFCEAALDPSGTPYANMPIPACQRRFLMHNAV